jgi:DNA-binding NtrC family response regulator
MSKASILVVEDDDVLAGVVRRILAGQGYQVRLAANAAEARMLARQESPQLALFDLCLPDGDGVSLGDEFSRHDPELPMILMTAYPLRLAERARGFARVLIKPLDLGELRSAVAGILNPDKLKTQPCEPALMVRS